MTTDSQKGAPMQLNPEYFEVATPEELGALPPGTIIKDPTVLTLAGSGAWWSDDKGYDAHQVNLPARVLYCPDAAERGES